MNIEYQLTMQDYLDFNIYHMNHSPSLKRTLFIERFIGPIIFLISPILLTKGSAIPLWYWYCVFTILSLLWIVLFPKYINKSISRRITKMLNEGKNTGILGNHSLSITEKGIIDKTEYSEEKFNFIEKVVESDKHIFIYVSSLSACIIPNRIFNNLEAKQEFLNALNLYCKS